MKSFNNAIVVQVHLIDGKRQLKQVVSLFGSINCTILFLFIDLLPFINKVIFVNTKFIATYYRRFTIQKKEKNA